MGRYGYISSFFVQKILGKMRRRASSFKENGNLVFVLPLFWKIRLENKGYFSENKKSERTFYLYLWQKRLHDMINCMGTI